MSDLAILTELVADAGISVDSLAGTGQASRALSQEGTPIQFLRERAKANGYELTFHDGTAWFGPRRLEAKAQAPILVYAGRETNCRNFTINDSADQPDEVRADIPPREEGATPETVVVTPDEPALGTTPTAAEGAGLGTPSVWRVGAEGDETSEERQARAQALVNEHAFKLRGSGELDGAVYGHVLYPGKPVPIDGAGPRYAGCGTLPRSPTTRTDQATPRPSKSCATPPAKAPPPASPLGAASSALSGLF